VSAIAGFWEAGDAADSAQPQACIDALLDALRHRGHHRTSWTGTCGTWALGQCNLEPKPALRACGERQERFVLAFAGSLRGRDYLHRELAANGAGLPAEVDDERLMLQGISRWGLQRMLARCEGAFALALWDRRSQRLTLAVDRFGQRPLYYGWCGKALVFASEPKALRAHPGFEDRIDTGALAQLLRLDYIPAPRTIHQGIAKLGPGQWVSLDLQALLAGPTAQPPPAVAYWHPESLMTEAVAARDGQRPLQAWLDAVEAALANAVARGGEQARPTLLLSGGVDSSLLAALMQRDSAEPLDAITITFPSPRHDEGHWAVAVARHLRVRHHVLRMDGRVAAELVPKLPQVWCEPFADPSQLPTLLACRMAAGWARRIHTGDGADELFFGHGAYARALRNHRLATGLPAPLRWLLERLPGAAPEAARLGGWAALREVLATGGLEASYLRRISRWREPGRALRGAAEAPLALLDRAEAAPSPLADADRIQLFDLSLDLPFGVLTKLDRAAGSRGLDVSCPFLDLEVAHLGWSLPLPLKFCHGQQKYLLRQLLTRHLPPELVWRRKQGFGPPIADWMSGHLREWAHALLDPVRLREQGLFDVELIGRMWREFLGGRRKWHTHLWNVLMFQAWHAHWREARPPAL